MLADTFNLHTDRTGFPKDWLPQNNERIERQQTLPIQVIVGNPPWSVGQGGVEYPDIRQRVGETYVARAKAAALLAGVYDTYKMSIRWASDRIGDRGVIALVTNGSWIDGNSNSGMRACLAEEFSSIHVVNLRGNQRTQGERSRREGGKVFGKGSRAPAAITILTKNPDAAHEGCRILYRDIGDRLSREDKLRMLREWGSITGIEDWEEIAPDRHHDWISQRNEAFRVLYPVGTKEGKARRTEEVIFRLFSNGYKSGRDAYVYNFSRKACVDNARRMVSDYNEALQELQFRKNENVDEITKRYSSSLKWDDRLKQKAVRRIAASFSETHLREAVYRPYVKSLLYADPTFAQAPARTRDIFPTSNAKNRSICVSGIGSTQPFSAIIVDTMPDLGLMPNGQCFPRYEYRLCDESQHKLWDDAGDLKLVDNISDTSLRAFRVRYSDNAITKDAIFNYVYGVLHAPAYRKRFANDLAKELPRIPLADDFPAFAEAGRQLEKLHLGYETCSEYQLEREFLIPGEPKPTHFRISARAMRFDDDERTILAVNDHLRLKGIPPQAHEYGVNGRTPLEWFIDRYQVKCDRESGIVNDANNWFEKPEDLISAICRIVYISVETVRIVKALPSPFADEAM